MAGKTGDFLEADLSSLSESETQVLQTLEAELKELGFLHLGNLIWQPGGDVQLLAYGHQEEQAYAIILISLFGIFTEFFSQSEQQVSQTTSTNPNPMPQPKKGHHKTGHPSLSLKELWQTHQHKLIELNIEPQKLKAEQLQFALCMDQFLRKDLA